MPTVRCELRKAARVSVYIPTLVEVIGQRDVQLHPELARVYERVAVSSDMVGKKFPAVIRDLSTNGAFISGPALPLLSRVAFTFSIEGHGQADALGWTLWRRRQDCEIPIEGDTPVRLQAGFGVLFEAIPLEIRRAIHSLVVRSGTAN
ncbi:MAG: hypothetical protein HY698_01320 [Deltaproteobacteria bacterium]|nr:hypothetical protein [Deltaproteobacteria bacterium]